MTDTRVLRERLRKAEDAYHDLMIGQNARVHVDQSGERVEYNPAQSAKLASYIDSLKSQIASATGERRSSGPLTFLF